MGAAAGFIKAILRVAIPIVLNYFLPGLAPVLTPIALKFVDSFIDKLAGKRVEAQKLTKEQEENIKRRTEESLRNGFPQFGTNSDIPNLDISLTESPLPQDVPAPALN